MKKQTFARAIASRWAVGAFCGAVFALIALLCTLTPYVADDYAYRISFADYGWIDSITDIIPSMYRHAFLMNGRVISHGIDQLFMLVPKAVFNLCNAAVFAAVVYAAYRLANYGKRRSVLLLGAIFAAIWLFLPAFGQVVLWQTGALNYLWGLALMLAFVAPYAVRYVRGSHFRPRIWTCVALCPAAFVFGMYIEGSSFIGALLAVCLLVSARILDGTTLRTPLWLPIAAAAAGYVCLFCMPAQIAVKGANTSLDILLANIAVATDMLRTHALPLLGGWVVLFILSCYARADRRRLVLSALFVFCALAANYMMCMAASYPDRCMATTVLLLIIADALLLAGLPDTLTALRDCLFAAIAVVCVCSLILGASDVGRCYLAFRARGQAVEYAKAEGQTDLCLPVIRPETDYTAFSGTADLNTESADTWPNYYIAGYYGVAHIIGE